MSATERAIRLIALAYGYGPHFDGVLDAYVAPAQRWTPTNRRTGDGDENNPAGTSGLSISNRSETLMRAGSAINPKDRRQTQLLSRCDADKLRTAQEWSDANSIRKAGRGIDYKVHEFEHWQTVTSVVMVPRARPISRVLDALADAELDGPLEPLLMFAATQDPRYWPKVKLHAEACGHPSWACDEAGLLVALGEWHTRRSRNSKHNRSASRRQRDRAKALCMRIEDYATVVHAAFGRLDEWLNRASCRVLDAMAPESSVLQNFGEPSATLAETWWHPDRTRERKYFTSPCAAPN